MIAECPIMLDKQQGRFETPNQFFNLHPGQHIDVVERFVPDIYMGALSGPVIKCKKTPKKKCRFLVGRDRGVDKRHAF